MRDCVAILRAFRAPDGSTEPAITESPGTKYLSQSIRYMHKAGIKPKAIATKLNLKENYVRKVIFRKFAP